MTQFDDIKSMLAEAPFFQGLDDSLLAEIAGCATVERFEAGSTVIRDGQPASKFHLIRHGTVAIELAAAPAGRLTLQTLQEGDILGWSWLMPRKAWGFDGRAVTLVRTISIDAPRLLEKMDRNHELGYQVLRRMVGVMATRLTAARMQMLDLYAPPSARGQGGGA